MPRRSHYDHRLPSPKVPLALAVAALAGLAFARWRLDRPPPPPTVALDAASYVTAVAPMFRRAGCADLRCHGGTAPFHLATSPTSAELLSEFDLVRALSRSGDAARGSPWPRVTGASHAGAGAFAIDGCEAATLDRFLGGAVVRPCAPALPDGGR